MNLKVLIVPRYSIRFVLLFLVFNSTAFGNVNVMCVENVHPVKRILFLGNSIVKHVPNLTIGWKGNWGMAASKESNDFVHLVIEKLADEFNSEFDYKVGNIANSFERKFWNFSKNDFQEFREYDPDLIVLKIGENVNEGLVEERRLDLQITRLVNTISENKEMKVCVIGSFWPKKVVEKCLSDLCKRRKWTYVSLDGVYQMEGATATSLYKNKDVGKHPSDKGMKVISERVFRSIRRLFKN